MGVISYISKKLLGIGCFIGTIFFVTEGVQLTFGNAYGFELSPITVGSVIGGICLVIGIGLCRKPRFSEVNN